MLLRSRKTRTIGTIPPLRPEPPLAEPGLQEAAMLACRKDGEPDAAAQSRTPSPEVKREIKEESSLEVPGHPPPPAGSQKLEALMHPALDLKPEKLGSLSAAQMNLFLKLLGKYEKLRFTALKLFKPDVSCLEEKKPGAKKEDSKEEINTGFQSIKPDTSCLEEKRSEAMEEDSKAEMYTDNTFINPLELHQENQEQRSLSSDGIQSSDPTCQPENLPASDPQDYTMLDINNRLRLMGYLICEICERIFSSKAGFRRHVSFHTGVKPFKCHACGRGFFLMPHLNKHLRFRCGKGVSEGNVSSSPIPPVTTCERVRASVQEDYYECRKCGRAFVQGVHLIQHLEAHQVAELLPRKLPLKTYSIRYQPKHYYMGRRAFQCCDCGKVFGQSSYLVHHYRIHAQGKPYQCRLCGKCFSLPSNLTQHYQMHSQGKQLSPISVEKLSENTL